MIQMSSTQNKLEDSIYILVFKQENMSWFRQIPNVKSIIHVCFAFGKLAEGKQKDLLNYPTDSIFIFIMGFPVIWILFSRFWMNEAVRPNLTVDQILTSTLSQYLILMVTVNLRLYEQIRWKSCLVDMCPSPYIFYVTSNKNCVQTHLLNF